MKSMAIISLAIALMLIPLMAVNCDCTGDTTAIKNVINDKWDAYNQGNYAKALTYCTNYEDKDKEITQMTAMKNVTGIVTVQSIEDIYISGLKATATVTLYMAGQTDTDEVKLVKIYGGWKIDIKEVDKYGSAQAERYTVQLAVTAAMFEVSVGVIDAGGAVSSIVCTVTYDSGTPLLVGDYIVGGIASLAYVYSVDTDGKVDAINGPLAE